MKMPKRILFSHELKKQIEQLLGESGFTLDKHEIHPFELLIYRRAVKDSEPDVIEFHGLEAGNRHCIYSSAATASRGGWFLKSIKDLVSNPENLPISQVDRWTYDTAEELQECLTEIIVIVRDKVLQWFETPSSRISVMDVNLRRSIGDKELESMIEKDLRIFEIALERALSEGNLEDVERYERIVQEFRRNLKRLKTKSE